MAKADIQLAVKGLRELRSLNIHLDRNSAAIDRSNDKLLKYAKSVTSHFVPSVNNFSAALRKANANLNSVSLNSDQATKAAQNLVRAENDVNDVLQQRAALVEKARGKTPGLGNEFTTSSSPFKSSRDFLGRTAEEQNAIFDERAKKITEMNEKNKEEFALVKKALAPKVKGTKIQQEQNKQINETLNLRAKEFMEIKKTIRAQDRRLKIEKKLGMGQEGRFGLNRMAHNLRGRGRSAMQARENATSNALIGGAFPLLFGQGAGASAGGALGGFAGGLLGGQFGFALSLVGTQIGSAIDSLINGAAELGKSLGPFTQDTQAVTDALGLQGSVQEAQINKIEELKGKTAAFIAAQKIMSAEIGQRGVDALKKFGESSRILGSQFALALTKLQAFTAGLFNFINTITGINKVLEQADANRVVKAEAALGDTEAQDLQNRQDAINEKTRGVNAFINPLSPTESIELSLKQKELDIEKKLFAIRKQVSVETDKITSKSDDLLLKKQQEFELNERTAEIMKGGVNKELAKSLAQVELQFEKEEELLQQKLKQTQAEFDKLANEKASDEVLEKVLEKEIQIEAEIDKHNEGKKETLNLTEKLFTETDKVAEAFKSVGETIQNDIKEGIKGLIKGTSTLSDLLNNVADRFLDVALNQALFGSILGSKGEKGGGIFGALGLFADGGRPPVNRPSIVGEKGPELFVPRSSGNIIPNNKLGGGNTNNVVVNVDASGSDVQGDEAAAKEIGTLISVAVQGELLKQQRPGGLLSR